MNVRFVTTHPEGWAVKAPNASRATGIHRTQREAEIEAKRIVKNLGDGEIRIQGRDSKWRDSDTVAPGNDPIPPRDKKH